MDPEPVPRLLLVTGVTYMTVGLVTLAVGIVFLVMESHQAVVAVWIVALVDGVWATIVGGVISSLACNQRSQSTPSLARLVVFTCLGGLVVGSQVALLVLSSFHVIKDETWREIHIFFFASAGIQLVALVIAALVLIKLTCDFPPIFKSSRDLRPDSQDNYGFLGDNDTWRSSFKETGSQGLVRWSGVENLERRDSSVSSVGGHYIASDHHPKYIGPSSGDSDETSSEQTAKIYADVHGEPGNDTSDSKHKMNGNVSLRRNGIVQRDTSHQTKARDSPSQLDPRFLTDRRTFESTNTELQKTSSHKSFSPKLTSSQNISQFPQRPPRRCDSYSGKSTGDRRLGRPPVPAPRSISTSPTGSPMNRSKQLFLYSPVQVELLSTQQKRELMQIGVSEPKNISSGFQRNENFQPEYLHRDEHRPGVVSSSYNHLSNGGPSSEVWNEKHRGSSRTVPQITFTRSSPENNAFRDSRLILNYDHVIPRSTTRSAKRPLNPPPPVPQKTIDRYRDASVFTVESHGRTGGDTRTDTLGDTATLKPPRKVTFLEAQEVRRTNSAKDQGNHRNGDTWIRIKAKGLGTVDGNLAIEEPAKGKHRAYHYGNRANAGKGEDNVGCNNENSIPPVVQAAIMIQRWYRRHAALLEMRRRYSWVIFQSLEYAGEQDQLKLHNFFLDLIKNSAKLGIHEINTCSPGSPSQNDEAELLNLTDPSDIKIGNSYKGPHLKFPLTRKELQNLLDAFRHKKVLHAYYFLQLLHEVRLVLKKKPNINQVSTILSQQITICGDLHGKLDDLFVIFQKNGFPSIENPYVFNGDFVDRGSHSVEVLAFLLGLVLLFPNSVHLNRGNHEDKIMNCRYGFTDEVLRKYKKHSSKIILLLDDVFSWLPLATVIDGKVLVVHGGISSETDLQQVAQADRHKFVSLLKPPLGIELGEDEPLENAFQSEEAHQEWKQILDLLWSDPMTKEGCEPNAYRGGGVYFGPDVTAHVLNRHGLKLLIRSHECKIEGFDYTHSQQCLTIFSASNYYDIGSNRGAYVKLMGLNLTPHIVQYIAPKLQKLTLTERISNTERSAVGSLKETISASKSLLIAEFQKHDPENTGQIHVDQWCVSMETVLGLQLPWRLLRERIVRSDPESGLVNYKSTCEDIVLDNFHSDKNPPDVIETLYRHKSSLETIFRMIDKNNSGTISMEEFLEGCTMLIGHIGRSLPSDDIRQIASTIDINKDGVININEFLEAFRLVDSH